MKKSLLIILLLISVIAPFSCKQKNIEPTYKMSSVLYKLDLSNAEFLTIMPSIDSYYGNNTLYKVTTDGVLEEVSQMSIDQKKLASSFYPYYFGMAGNYFIIGSSSYEIYLIRKSDGILYKVISDDSTPSFTSSNGEIKAMSDAKGNIYVMGYGYSTQAVYKINTTSSGFMKISLYSPAGESSITDFEIDSRGNLLYQCTTDYYNQYHRLLKTDGSVTDMTGFTGMTLGKDDNFYLSQSSTYSTIDIIKMTINESLTVTTTYLGNYQSGYTMFDTNYKAYNGNRTVYADGSKITELNPDNGSVINYTSPATSISDITYSSSDLYIMGYDYYYSYTIYKIPNSGYASYTFPLPANAYNPYQLAASNNGNLLVSGTRSSDSRNVLVRVDSGGNISTLREDINLYSVSLWKID